MLLSDPAWFRSTQRLKQLVRTTQGKVIPGTGFCKQLISRRKRTDDQQVMTRRPSWLYRKKHQNNQRRASSHDRSLESVTHTTVSNLIAGCASHCYLTQNYVPSKRRHLDLQRDVLAHCALRFMCLDVGPRAIATVILYSISS